MRNRFFHGAVAAVALLVLGGCVAKGDYIRKEAEADILQRNLSAATEERAALQERIGRLTAEAERRSLELQGIRAEQKALRAEMDRQTWEKKDLEARLGAKEQELSAAAAAMEDLKRKTAELEGDKQMLRESIALLRKTKEEEVQTVSRTYEDLLNEMKGEIEQGQIAIRELEGKLTMDVVDKILFDSGRAEVKQEGLSVLKRVVGILKTVTDKTIRVEGHTDNVQIGGSLAQRYPTNWELSAARAIHVARYLEKEGIDPLLLSAAAFGEYQPVADNDTPEGRARNRRIAIILLPKE